jgi:hypothetical protein
MKYITLLFFATLNSFSLQSQIVYEYVSQVPYGNFQTIDVDAKGNLVAAGALYSCSAGYLAYFDTTGAPLWERQISEAFLSPLTDVFFDRQGHIVVIGPRNVSDDYGSYEDGAFMMKFDSLGNQLLTTRLSHGSYRFQQLKGIQMPDGTFRLAAGKQLVWLSEEGDSLKMMSLDVERIIDLEVGTDSSLFVLSEKKAIWLDLDGQPLDEHTTSEDFIDACQKGDTTWILGRQNVWLFSGPTSKTEVFPLPSNFQAKGISPKINGVGVLVWSQQEFLHFSNGLWSSPPIEPIVGTQIQEVINWDSTYFFAGEDLWEPIASGRPLSGAFVSATTEGYGRTTEIRNDLSIENLTIELTAPLDTFDKIFLSDTLFAYGVRGQFSGTLEVQNGGSRPIHDFVFFSAVQGSFNCGEGRVFQKVDSINLAPGALLQIPIQFFDYTYYYVDGGGTLNRCFYIAAPNQQFDEISGNNNICLTLLTNTREPLLTQAKIKVFPNPAKDYVRVQSEGNRSIQQIDLINLAGQRQNLNVTSRQNIVEIERTGWPAGLYLLRIRTEDGIIVRKVIFD